MRLRLVDRYVLQEMSGPFWVGLVVYSFLFLIQLIFQLASLVIQEGLSAGAMALMFLLSLPGLLAYTLPIALLLGTIIAFGRLSSDSEIIALRASGIPSGKLVRPPLLFGAAVAGVLLLFNFWLVPACRSAADRLQGEATQAMNLVRLLRPGVFFDRIPGVLLYAEKVDEASGRYEHVLVFQRSSGPIDTLTLARGGRTVRSPDGRTLQFLLEDGETVKFDRKSPGKVETTTFDEQALTVDTGPAGQSGMQKGLAELGTLSLLGRLTLPPQSSDPGLALKERAALRFELHRRIAASLAALFFALIGMSLGMVNVRGGKGAGFSLSLVVLLGYWVLLSALSDLALAGRVNPVLAAYVPDAALLAVGLILLRRKDRMASGGWVQAMLGLFPGRATAGELEQEGVRPIPLTRGIPILDRYLLKRMAAFLALIVASILLLDWVIEVRGLSEFMTNQDKIHLLVTYLLNHSPGILIMLTPLAVLMAALVTFALLERTNELTAMKASGLSLYRISLPVLAVGLGACLFLWALGEGAVPSTSRKAQTTRDAIKGIASRGVASTLDVWLFAPGRRQLFHYRHYDAKSKAFQGFSIYTLQKDHFKLASRFFAKEAHFSGTGTLSYARGWEWRRDPAKPFEAKPSGTLALGLPREYFVVPPFTESQYFSSGDLKKLIAELREKGYPTYQQRVDYYQKFADATAPLVLLLLGLPFAFVTGRRGSLYGIAIALGLSILYYALGAVFNSVGAMQWLDPALAAWAPAVLLGSAGGYLLLNVRT